MALTFGVAERPVMPVSARTTFSGDYTGPSARWDLMVGGIPFQMQIDDQRQYRRSTLPWKRQQVDTSPEPGEQTFSTYWVRDQESWHRGSGINFYEPATDPYSRYRYTNSVGLDVWTVGQLSLLNAVSREVTATGTNAVGVASAVRSSVNGVYYTTGGILGWYPDGGPAVTYTMGGTTATTAPVVAGSKVLWGYADGIAAATVGSESPATLWTGAGATVTPYWVKSRVIATKGANLYDLTLTGGALPAALFTHPDSTWTWTSVTETPDSILLAGRSNGYSAIYALTLQTTGGAGTIPTLGPCVQVAEFPPGEEVHCIKAYLGAFLAIGTTRGVRIAQLGSNGQMQYGPLTIATTQPVRALAAHDSFVYAAIDADIDGASGCARINLGEEITSQVNGLGSVQANTMRFAWAYDVRLSSGNTSASIGSLGMLGNSSRVALGATGNGLFIQSGTQYVSTGYLLSGKIRHSTAEQKIFPWLKLRTSVTSDATVQINTIDQGGTETFALQVDRNVDESVDVALPAISDIPQSHVAIKLVLNASSDGLTTPTILHQQLKALPKPNLQRQITYPVKLHDREQDRDGNVMGFDSWAWDRLQQLELLQQEHVIVQVEDNTCGESYAGTIADVEFLRDTPPSRGATNFGGVAMVTLVKL